MKRTALLIVLMLCFCTAAAWAQAPVPMDKAQFLASLGTPQPVEAASRRIQTKSTCTVTLTCDVGGYPLQCTSTSGNCSAGATWISCDDNQQNCPICYKSRTCCDGSVRECWGWFSCGPGVTCDGNSPASCPPIRQCATP
jgi:hypothetical protein